MVMSELCQAEPVLTTLYVKVVQSEQIHWIWPSLDACILTFLFKHVDSSSEDHEAEATLVNTVSLLWNDQDCNYQQES